MAATSAADRPSHALIRGLRRQGNEGQLTKVIGEIASSDPRFASAFVRSLVAQASADCGSAEQARRLGAVPSALECTWEEDVGRTEAQALGRVDLAFYGSSGNGDFTLFVENKLDSGYGKAQLDRYLTALRLLPPGRSALVAVTKRVPAYGERVLDDKKHPDWLGSVRWARLLPRLRKLPIENPRVRQQWGQLLDVLDHQGDLGMTKVNAAAIRAWARYLEGREQLEFLLDQVREPVTELVREELHQRYKRPHAELAAINALGAKQKQMIKKSQTSVGFAFRVPAKAKTAALTVLFEIGDEDEPLFAVYVAPRNARKRLEKGEAQLESAVEKLRKEDFGYYGFPGERGTIFGQWYGPEEYLDHKDVPSKLVKLTRSDVRQIVKSEVLDGDLKRS
jgi:hypothetical protein